MFKASFKKSFIETELEEQKKFESTTGLIFLYPRRLHVVPFYALLLQLMF